MRVKLPAHSYWMALISSGFLALLILVGCSGVKLPEGKIPVTTSSEKALEYYLEGRSLAYRLRSGEARSLFARDLEVDSNFALAHLDMARTAVSESYFYSSIERAMALAGSVSEGERLWIQATHASSVEGRPRKAAELYARIVALYPRDELAHLLLATHYLVQREMEKSIDAANAALAVNPDFSAAYNVLGYAHKALKQYDLAENAFKHYIRLIPTEPNPYDSYAELLLARGRFDEAIDNYKQALEINPGFTTSVVGIASALNFLNRHEEARQTIRDLMKKTDGLPSIRALLPSVAISYIDQGFYDSASFVIRQLQEHCLANFDTLSAAQTSVILGDICLEMGTRQRSTKRIS